MRHKNLVFSLLLLLLLTGLPAFAQSWAGHGRLQGEIKDEQGHPVEGAQVWLRMGTNAIDPNNPGDGPKVVTTTKYGKWSILGLAQGTWRVLIVKDGFMPSEGQVKVLEGGAPPPPIQVTLRVVPKEAKQAAQGNEALEALNRGNDLLTQEKYAEARAEYEK